MLSKSLMFVQMFSKRSRGASLYVAGGALLVSLAIAGCGGGGGGGLSNATPTPIATSVSAACNTTTYSPNYYGLPEPGSTDSSSNVYNYWRQFPITVYIPSSASSAFRASTLDGFDQWVDASGGRASYQLVSSASGANLVVSYSPLDANSDTLGLTTVSYNANQNYIISAKMELFFYTTSDRSDANITNQSIAAHEFGHALGLGPHSPFAADLMYPTLERAREQVTTRDINTLKTIYCNQFPTRTTAALKNEGPFATKTYRTRSK